MIKTAGPTCMQWFYRVIKIKKEKKILEEWRKGIIISIFKKRNQRN